MSITSLTLCLATTLGVSLSFMPILARWAQQTDSDWCQQHLQTSFRRSAARFSFGAQQFEHCDLIKLRDTVA